MADVLKGFTGGTFAFALAWILPNIALLSLVAAFVYPTWVQLGVPDFVKPYDLPTRLLALGFLGVFLGLLGATGSTPLYRLLEGYAWPASTQEWARQRKLKKRDKLNETWNRLSNTSGLRASLLYEKLSRYPAVDDEVAPTDLGNAIRVFEIYGRLRFGLDSQTLWTELYSVVPDALRREVNSARAGVDLFVAALYASLSFGLIAIATSIAIRCKLHQSFLPMIGASVIAPGLAWAWYRIAVSGCSYWQDTVQALVNLGRLPLAASLGLRLPSTQKDERKLWTAMTAFVNGDMGKARIINRYRLVPEDTDGSHDNA